MKLLLLPLLLIGLLSLIAIKTQASETSVAPTLCTDNSRFMKRQLANEQVDDICRRYQGKVMLIVNTASQCAFTNQYEGLESLYRRYRDQGLVVLGFPSNDFGSQEPGSEREIQNFCQNTYAVQFPMYEKIRVRGDNADPLYQALAAAADSKPRWNFHKYLVDRNGRVVDAFSSMTSPLNGELVQQIETLLAEEDINAEG